ncbi:DNA repair protein RadC [Brevibacillus brevis]|uniref:DNA repair protein RadC n=2 Tax=Brevibacillus brevis TaxID=1393 RepID=A0ABY9T5Q9_BREBE|nr:DNA repair protein RadC [Brevibacillus brevis]WNC15443.1 DNA repair protein RadC [Brevibacillus brevis]
MQQIDMFQYECFATDFVQKAKESVSFYGTKEANLNDLLTIIIGNEADAVIIHKLAGIGIQQLASMSAHEIMELVPISEMAAQRIVASFGLAHKYVTSPREKRISIRLPRDVAELMMPEMRYLTQEHFICLFLNTKNRVIGKQTIFIGSLDASVVHPREVFKEAIKRSAANVICLHNHPSGDPTPSREDIKVTKNLMEAGEVVGIPLLDHVIIGDDGYISLKEQRYI